MYPHQSRLFDVIADLIIHILRALLGLETRN